MTRRGDEKRGEETSLPSRRMRTWRVRYQKKRDPVLSAWKTTRMARCFALYLAFMFFIKHASMSGQIGSLHALFVGCRSSGSR
mmetsp:Transcript_15375/g.38873  ORF Transcript_15375/g.38873 Transcript_15375/m.38873 type:complete len:83 (+) Transcript_15375:1578-1826(+)